MYNRGEFRGSLHFQITVSRYVSLNQNVLHTSKTHFFASNVQSRRTTISFEFTALTITLYEYMFVATQVWQIRRNATAVRISVMGKILQKRNLH